MARPHKERRVEQLPPVTHFKPPGVPLKELEEMILTIEEMEAIRLFDLEELDQGAAAAQMEVSRPTFHRIVTRAHKKIATALWRGMALRVDGGTFRIDHCHQRPPRQFTCQNCNHQWSVPHGNNQRGKDMTCPICQSSEVSRIHSDQETTSVQEKNETV
jgi:predicted DNA-binding protein (UPF0251 family)